jgi:hypothetical protein
VLTGLGGQKGDKLRAFAQCPHLHNTAPVRFQNAFDDTQAQPHAPRGWHSNMAAKAQQVADYLHGLQPTEPKAPAQAAQVKLATMLPQPQQMALPYNV